MNDQFVAFCSFFCLHVLTFPACLSVCCQADELGADLSSRRKSTLAAMLGRVRLDNLAPQQQAALLGPSPAARILDLLLTLGSTEERLTLLPDCFAPPDEPAEQQEGPSGATTTAPGAAAAAAGDGEEGTDELWCTPMQLLNEIHSRLGASFNTGATTAAAAAAGQLAADTTASGSGRPVAPQVLLPDAESEPGGSSTGVVVDAAVLAALQELRQHIQCVWLSSLPAAGHSREVDGGHL